MPKSTKKSKSKTSKNSTGQSDRRQSGPSDRNGCSATVSEEMDKKIQRLIDAVFESHIWPMLEEDGWISGWQKSRKSKRADGLEEFFVPPNLPAGAPLEDSCLETKKRAMDYITSNNYTNRYVKEFIFCCNMLCKDATNYKLDETEFIFKVKEIMLLRDIEEFINNQDVEQIDMSSGQKDPKQRLHRNAAVDQSQKNSTSLKGKSAKKRATSNVSNKSDLVEFVKEMPRAMGPDFTFNPILIFPSEKVQFLFEDLTLSQNNLSKHPDRKELLQVKVEDSEEDVHTVIFSAVGRKDLVQEVEIRVQTYIRGIVALQNLKGLLNDSESVMLNVNLLATEKIGAHVFDIPELDKLSDKNAPINWAYGLPENFCMELDELEAGVWITGLKRDQSELRNVISNLLTYGGCILKVDDVNVHIYNDIIVAWNSGIKKKEFIKLTLCVSKRANLALVDPKRVVLDSDGVLKVRGGSVCSTWSFDPIKGFALKSEEEIYQIIDDERQSSHSLDMTTYHLKDKSPLKKKGKCESKQAMYPQTGNKSNPDITSRNAPSHSTEYNMFCLKYQMVYEIEYNFRGFNKSPVCKSMWNQHTKLYGPSCPERCPCASRLPDLCQRIVSDILDNSSSRSADNGEVGFVKFFYNKYYSKIARDFPSKSPEQILQKLANCWKKHQQIRSCGLKCSSDCACADRSDLFLDTVRDGQTKMSNGADLSKPNDNGIPTKMVSQSNEPDGRINQEKCLQMGAKNLPIFSSLSSKPSREKQSFKPSKVSSRHPKEFTIKYDPHKPLGFYCITKEIATTGTMQKESMCEIYSVYPYGTRKDDRIRPGTTIVAYSLIVGNAPQMRVDLSSHLVLESRYSSAKLKGSSCNLQLYFVKTNVNMIDKPLSSEDWDRSGQWAGHSISPGWAGGAETFLKRKDSDEMSSLMASNASLHRIDNEKSQTGGTERCAKRGNCSEVSAPPRRTSFDETSQAQSKSLIQQPHMNACQSLASFFTLTSISSPTIQESSRKNNEDGRNNGTEDNVMILSSAKRRVSFSEDPHKEHCYNPQFAACCVQPSGSAQDNQADLTHTSLQDQQPLHQYSPASPNESVSRDALSLAVRNNDIRKVLEILKSGLVDVQCKDSQGKKPLKYAEEISKDIKNKLINANNEEECGSPQYKVLQNELKDFELKKELLKIFINVVYCINDAIFIENWKTIEFRINKVYNLQLSSLGVDKCTPDVFCSTTYNGAKKRELNTPIKHFDKKIVWDDGITYGSNDFRPSTRPCCFVRYNEMTSNQEEEVSIVIDLIMRHSEHEEYNITLGSATPSYDSVRELIDYLTKAGHGHKNHRKLTADVIATPYLQRDAKIELSLLNPESDKYFNSRMHARIKNKLKDVINRIQDFNTEMVNLADGNNYLIDYNICAQNCNGFTLLHAAIYLKDPLIVQQLLDMGADPEITCPKGTGLELAMMLCEHHKAHHKECDGCRGSYDVLEVLKSFTDASGNRDTKRYKRVGNESYNKYLPIVANTDWVIMNGTTRCQYFNQPSGCKLGPKCKNLHVHSPAEEQLKRVKHMTSEELQNFVNDQYIIKINVVGENGNIYHTAAYRNQNNVIYYAEKGSNGERSKQGLYWYRDSISAEEAVLRVVAADVTSTRSSNDMHISRPQVEHKLSLPDLPNSDWMCPMLRRSRCALFDKGICRYSNQCKNLHFKKPFNSDPKVDPLLAHCIKECGEILKDENIYYNTVRAIHDGSSWYTAAYVHPVEKIIFYVEGKYDVDIVGHKSSQGLFWYPSRCSALDSIRKVVYASSLVNKDEVIKEDVNVFNDLVAFNNFSNIHYKIHAILLKKRCWDISNKKIGRKQLFTATLNPHTVDFSVVFPIGCDGIYDSGVYWYKDQRLAKAATYFTYLEELVKRDIIKDLRHMSDGDGPVRGTCIVFSCKR